MKKTVRIYSGINFVTVEKIHLQELIDTGFVYDEDGHYSITDYCGSLDDLDTEVERLDLELEKAFDRCHS